MDDDVRMELRELLDVLLRDGVPERLRAELREALVDVVALELSRGELVALLLPLPQSDVVAVTLDETLVLLRAVRVVVAEKVGTCERDMQEERVREAVAEQES